MKYLKHAFLGIMALGCAEINAHTQCPTLKDSDAEVLLLALAFGESFVDSTDTSWKVSSQNTKNLNLILQANELKFLLTNEIHNNQDDQCIYNATGGILTADLTLSQKAIGQIDEDLKKLLERKNKEQLEQFMNEEDDLEEILKQIDEKTKIQESAYTSEEDYIKKIMELSLQDSNISLEQRIENIFIKSDQLAFGAYLGQFNKISAELRNKVLKGNITIANNDTIKINIAFRTVSEKGSNAEKDLFLHIWRFIQNSKKERVQAFIDALIGVSSLGTEEDSKLRLEVLVTALEKIIDLAENGID
jgi:hypothetical protein